MALYKRGNIWWITITHQGTRVQQSTGTSSKVDAKRLYDELKAQLWKVDKLKQKPNKDWCDAVIRWCTESQHKKSFRCDKSNLKWLDEHLRNVPLKNITRDTIETIAIAKEREGVSPATVNRVLALIRTILRKAEREWEWLDRTPTIRMRKEDTKRIRWITEEEARKLKNELPGHLAHAMEFALQTGLRESNIINLEWSEVDFERCHAFIPARKSKSGKAIAVPLNSTAIEIIRLQQGNNPKYVFSYNGRRTTRFNNHAWRKALKRAGITNFRWHDLRHTWASWHIQRGTSLQELQQLGGWASFDMVLRYAHLSSAHLQGAAERISATNLLQSSEKGFRKVG